MAPICAPPDRTAPATGPCSMVDPRTGEVLAQAEVPTDAHKRVEVPRPRGAGIKALLTMGGAVAGALVACERPAERERTASVKLLGSGEVAS